MKLNCSSHGVPFLCYYSATARPDRSESGFPKDSEGVRLMNSRRLMGVYPRPTDHGLGIEGLEWISGCASQQKAVPLVRDGSKRESVPCGLMSAFGGCGHHRGSASSRKGPGSRNSHNTTNSKING